MQWYLIHLGPGAPNAGLVLRGDELAETEEQVSVLREGRVVYVVPRRWFRSATTYALHKEAEAGLAALRRARHGFQAAQPVTAEHAVARPPSARRAHTGGGWVDAGGLRISVGDPRTGAVGAPRAEPGAGRAPAPAPAPPEPETPGDEAGTLGEHQ